MITESADLHIHSCFSDSSFSPSRVIQQAIANGLGTIAISDHDTVQGVEETLELARKQNITAIPACEISTVAGNREAHILGYHVDWQNTQLKRRLEWLCRKRKWRVYEMVRKLAHIGINIHVDDVFSISGEGSTGRIHIAIAIIQKGYENTIHEVFKKYIGYGSPGFVPKSAIPPEEAIDLILQAKGIPVYAHPGLSRMDECIPRWIKRGLQGLEVYHPSQDQNLRKFYTQLALKYNLCITGGSDCHGMWKESPLIGSVRLPTEYVEKLNQIKADKG